MRLWTQRAVTMMTAVAAAAVVLIAPGSAALAGTTQLSGVANFAEDCEGETSDWTLVIDGDLEGCWYTSVEDATVTPSGVYIETGTEEFVGCLDVDGVEACGSFTTTYRFTGKFEDSGAQIHGRCQHPIVEGSGTGDFTGATGRLDFKDDVETGEASYEGHIKLVP